MKEADLLKLKGEITEAKSTVKNLEGRRDLLLEQLKEKWGVKTGAEASKKIKSLEASIAKFDTEIGLASAALEQELGNESDTNT